jgi:hypothetical protein
MEFGIRIGAGEVVTIWEIFCEYYLIISSHNFILHFTFCVNKKTMEFFFFTYFSYYYFLHYIPSSSNFSVEEDKAKPVQLLENNTITGKCERNQIRMAR